MKTHSVKARVLAPFVLALSILIAFSVAATSLAEKHKRDIEALSAHRGVAELFRAEVYHTALAMDGTLDVLSADPRLAVPFLAEDPEALLEVARPLYEKLNAAQSVTHLYFIGVDRAAILRAHDPQHVGGIVKHRAVLEAQRTGEHAWGIELGARGTFTLRAVTPWRFDGRLIGYLELGQGVEQIARCMQEALEADVCLTVGKEQISRDVWEDHPVPLGYHAKWDDFRERVVVGRGRPTVPLSVLRAAMDDPATFTPSGSDVSFARRRFHAGAMPLTDAAEGATGALLFAYENTNDVLAARRRVWTVGLVSLAVGAALCILFYSALTNLERNLDAARVKLLAESVALRASQEKYRSIVENVGIGIALLSPQMEILELNRQMQEWFPNVNPDERPICYRAYNDPPREALCSYCPTVKTLQDGEVHEAVTEMPAGDETRHYRIVSSAVRAEDGSIAGAIEMVEDITYRVGAEQELDRVVRRLAELSITDELTGVANRRYLMQRLTGEEKRSARTGRAFSLLMVDLDHFKEINDEHGHAVGDEALKRCAAALQEGIREVDLVGRYGGEEFCLLLVDTAGDGATLLAERLRRAVEDLPDPMPTISIGVAVWRPTDFQGAVLIRADRALYRAKAAGRNCVAE